MATDDDFSPKPPPGNPWRLAGLGPGELIRRVARRFGEDRIADQSAKMSFYFLLSIFPLLYFLTSILGLVMRKDERATQALHEMLAAVMPPSAWTLLDATLTQVRDGAGGGLQLSIALLVTIWTASRGMVAIIEGLNVAYGVRQYRSWLRRNLLAVALTFAFAVATALALPLLMYGERVAQRVVAQWGAWAMPGAWHVAERILALGLVLVAFNVLYVAGPNARNRQWHWLMPGTAIGACLWLAASYGLRLYLRFFDNYSAMYGSIGAVVVMMLWFYLSGIAILVGGEFNSEIEKAARGGAKLLPRDERNA